MSWFDLLLHQESARTRLLHIILGGVSALFVADKIAYRPLILVLLAADIAAVGLAVAVAVERNRRCLD